MNRMIVTEGLDLVCTAASVEEALDLLKQTAGDGDYVLWRGQQIVAVHFSGGSVLRLWPQAVPQDVTRN